MAKAALASPPAAIALLPTEQLPTRQTTFVPVVRANTLLPTANDDRVNPAVPTKRLAPDCEASPVPVLTNRLFLISFPEPVGARARVVTDVHRRHAAAARVVDEAAVPELEVRHRRRRDAARSVEAEEVRIRVDPRRDVEEVVVHSDVVRRRIREGVEVDVRVADVDEVVAVLGQHAGGAGELDGRAERLEDRTASPAFPRAASPSPATQCNRDRILVQRPTLASSPTRPYSPQAESAPIESCPPEIAIDPDVAALLSCVPSTWTRIVEPSYVAATNFQVVSGTAAEPVALVNEPGRRVCARQAVAAHREGRVVQRRLPLPERSGALVPDPWSKDYAATRPAPAAPAS